MFLFILAIIFLIAAIVIAIVGDFKKYNGETQSIRGYALIPLALGLILLPLSCLRTVDAGSVGLPITFGSVGDSMDSGVHFMAPWSGVENINVRTAEYTMTVTQNEGKVVGDDSVEVKGKDGATGHVDSTTHYHINRDKAAELYRTVGKDYEGTVVRPSIRNCIHNAFGATEMVLAATTARTDIQSGIDTCVKNALESRGFVVEDFQIRNIRVEEAVQNAINAKVAAQQEAESKQFQLQAARQDAEKTRIQSQAVSDGQQIIKCGGHTVQKDDGTSIVLPNEGADCKNQLTPEYLQWYYIDMLKSVVSSPNHDTIIVPSSNENLQVQIPANK